MKQNTNYQILSIFLIAIFSLVACRKAELTNSLNSTTTSSIPNEQSLLSISNLNSFKVLSFNIRHNDPDDPQTLTERRPLIRQIIVDNDPDVFGIQEASDASFRSWFFSEMQTLGYAHTLTGGLSSPKVIFYKSARFDLQRQDTFLLGTQGVSGTWAQLWDNVSNKGYFFCNSHWTPGSGSEPLSKRMINAQTVVDEVNDQNINSYPIIVFGDFNAQPDSGPINLLKSGLSVEDGLGDIQGTDTFHGWNATGSSKLDWIFSNRKMAFFSWEVIETSYNDYWPSDHWPVMVTYLPAIFGEGRTDANGISESSNTSFHFADINGDGKADKVFRNISIDGGRPKVFLSNGDGTYNFAGGHVQGQSALSTTQYNYADVNGDGKADEIIWDPTLYSGHTRVFLATSGGNFSSTAVENSENGSTTTGTIYKFADLNGDGKSDKIRWTASYDGGNTSVNLATSGGQFGSTISDATGAIQLNNTNFYYVDVNADNKADKIVWNRTVSSGRPQVYLSDGDGTFTYSGSFSTTGTGGTSTTTEMYFADLDGDNRAEKIFWNPQNYLGKIKVYYSQSDNTFSSPPVYSLRGISESINTHFYFADINGDGKMDQIRWDPTLSDGKLASYFYK